MTKTARKTISEDYNKWLESALTGDQRKDYALLGNMGTSETSYLTKIGQSPESSSIIINDRLVSGKKAERHQKAGNALTPDEWKSLPGIINNPERVLFDTVDGNLLYVTTVGDQRVIKGVIDQDVYDKKLKGIYNPCSDSV
jgi:hypothetical protein